MRELAVGVVGCGYVADFYLRCLRSDVPEARVVGVYDFDHDRARSAVGDYGGIVYPSLPALLDQPGLDVVLNLTPCTARWRPA
jgi:predicted dehydrogenase